MVYKNCLTDTRLLFRYNWHVLKSYKYCLPERTLLKQITNVLYMVYIPVNVGEDCPVFDGMYEFCQLSTGGSVGKCQRSSYLILLTKMYITSSNGHFNFSLTI